MPILTLKKFDGKTNFSLASLVSRHHHLAGLHKALKVYRGNLKDMKGEECNEYDLHATSIMIRLCLTEEILYNVMLEKSASCSS